MNYTIEDQRALERAFVRKKSLNQDAFASITASVVIPKAALRLKEHVGKSIEYRAHHGGNISPVVTFLHDKVLVNDTKAISVLFVTWRTIISSIQKTPSLEALSTLVGEEALLEIKILELNRIDYKRVLNLTRGFSNIHFVEKTFKGTLKYDRYDSTFRKKLGSYLLNMFRDFIYLKKDYKFNRYKYVVALKPAMIELLLKYRDKAAVPLFIPTIIPPKEPTREDLTIGYYFLKKKLITGYLVNSKVNVDSPHIEALKHVQRIPFTLDNEMCTILNKMVNDKYSGIAELPYFQLEAPPKPWSTDDEYDYLKEHDPDVIEKWKIDMREAHKLQKSSEGKVIALAFLRNIISTFESYDHFYFPVFLDFRGRMYYAPAYLNYQGADWAKGVLTFKHKEPLNENGLKWLRINLANKAGVDKVTYDERLQWVAEHEEDILKSAKDPLGYLWWADMDEPFQFLKLAKAYHKYVEKPKVPLSVIVSVDGSNNGTQHLSAMSRNYLRAKYVNLTKEDKVYDIYQIAADALIDQIHKEKPKDETEKRIRNFWLHGNDGEPYITRSLIKRPVMTKAYSVTFGGMVDQIVDYMLHNNIRKPLYVKDWPLVSYVVKRLDKILQELMSIDIMDWLKNVAKTLKNQSIEWDVPTGFHVHQAYYKRTTKKIMTMWGYHKIEIRDHRYSDKINPRAMQLGISPNFVHSYDAAHLVLLVNKFKKEFPDAPIAIQHDSFGTHPNYMEDLQRIIRETFVELYTTRDVLREQKKYWETKYNIKLPEPPIEGDFDLTEVLEAPYFFS